MSKCVVSKRFLKREPKPFYHLLEYFGYLNSLGMKLNIEINEIVIVPQAKMITKTLFVFSVGNKNTPKVDR